MFFSICVQVAQLILLTKTGLSSFVPFFLIFTLQQDNWFYQFFTFYHSFTPHFNLNLSNYTTVWLNEAWSHCWAHNTVLEKNDHFFLIYSFSSLIIYNTPLPQSESMKHLTFFLVYFFCLLFFTATAVRQLYLFRNKVTF